MPVAPALPGAGDAGGGNFGDGTGILFLRAGGRRRAAHRLRAHFRDFPAPLSQGGWLPYL